MQPFRSLVARVRAPPARRVDARSPPWCRRGAGRARPARRRSRGRSRGAASSPSSPRRSASAGGCPSPRWPPVRRLHRDDRARRPGSRTTSSARSSGCCSRPTTRRAHRGPHLWAGVPSAGRSAVRDWFDGYPNESRPSSTRSRSAIAAPALFGHVLSSRARLNHALREKAEALGRAAQRGRQRGARGAHADRRRAARRRRARAERDDGAGDRRPADGRARPGARRGAFATVEATGREALTELRRLLGVLRREDEELGLAPQPSLAHVGALVRRARAGGLPVELLVEGEPRPLPAGVDLTAYRLVQEALGARARRRRRRRRRGDPRLRPVRAERRDRRRRRARRAGGCSACASGSRSTAARCRPARSAAAAGASPRGCRSAGRGACRACGARGGPAAHRPALRATGCSPSGSASGRRSRSRAVERTRAAGVEPRPRRAPRPGALIRRRRPLRRRRWAPSRCGLGRLPHPAVGARLAVLRAAALPLGRRLARRGPWRRAPGSRSRSPRSSPSRSSSDTFIWATSSSRRASRRCSGSRAAPCAAAAG